jgi:murein DD-endopeptidase MepM/ murein hydrolase activator NlpD
VGVKGLGDLSIEDVLLDGAKLSGEVTDAVERLGIARKIDGASTANLSLRDPNRAILKSGLFDAAVALTIDELIFELVGLKGNDDRSLTAVFESGGVADLRKQKGVKIAKPNTTTRTEFAHDLVRAVKHLGFNGEKGTINKKAIGRGIDDNKKEDSWECINRLAADRGWRSFESEGDVWFGSDDWLVDFNDITEINVDDDDGIVGASFDIDAGKRAHSLTLSCYAKRWALRPGEGMKVKGLSELVRERTWIVASIDRPDIGSQLTTVSLTRKSEALPEPVADVPDDYDDSGTYSATGATSSSGASSGGWSWPVTGPITSDFGPRGENDYHYGIDIGVGNGTPVWAARDGTVSFAGEASGYGIAVYIDHGDGITTRYGHLQSVSVRAGQVVKRGDQIALSNNTGNSTGPHLHFEIRVGGAAVDPMGYLP